MSVPNPTLHDTSGLFGKRVLLAEDESCVATTMTDILTYDGCVVVGPFVSVSEALVAVSSEVIDVALLDVNLAGELSYPVATALEARGVPFLFVTGYGPARMPTDCPHWVACKKPIPYRRLVAALTERLAKR